MLAPAIKTLLPLTATPNIAQPDNGPECTEPHGRARTAARAQPPATTSSANATHTGHSSE